MGPATFIIALLGCGEGDAPCQQVETLPAHYSSIEACTAATDEALLSADLLSYPVVVAQCMKPGTPASALIYPGQVELPDADAPREGAKGVRYAGG